MNKIENGFKKTCSPNLETGAKKSELVFQAITVIRNGIRAFQRFTKLFIMKNPFRKGKACFCSSTGS